MLAHQNHRVSRFSIHEPAFMSMRFQNGQRCRHRATFVFRMCAGLRHTLLRAKFRHDEELVPCFRADADHLARICVHVAA